jgi:hypothetical protein
MKFYDSDEKKAAQKAKDDIIGRCRTAQADTAFIWILFIFFIVTVGLTFMSRSSKRGGALV